MMCQCADALVPDTGTMGCYSSTHQQPGQTRPGPVPTTTPSPWSSAYLCGGAASSRRAAFFWCQLISVLVELTLATVEDCSLFTQTSKPQSLSFLHLIFVVFKNALRCTSLSDTTQLQQVAFTSSSARFGFGGILRRHTDLTSIGK